MNKELEMNWKITKANSAYISMLCEHYPYFEKDIDANPEYQSKIIDLYRSHMLAQNKFLNEKYLSGSVVVSEKECTDTFNSLLNFLKEKYSKEVQSIEPKIDDDLVSMHSF